MEPSQVFRYFSFFNWSKLSSNPKTSTYLQKSTTEVPKSGDSYRDYPL